MQLQNPVLATLVISSLFVGPVAAQDAVPSAARLPVYPLDVVVSPESVAYVVDRNLPGVWQWKNDELSIFFEGSPKFRTPLNAARCLAFDQNGNLLVGDSSTRDIYRVSKGGKAEPITGGEIGIPMDIAVKPDGTIYVADLELKMLLRIPAGSSKVEQVAPVNPRGVYIDGKEQIWVVSQSDEQLQIVSDDGKVDVVVDHRVFEFPHQVVVNAAGEAFVSDGYKKAIWKVVKGSPPEIVFEGKPFDNPVGIALVEDQLVVVDPRAKTVFRLGKDNKPQVWIELKRQ